MVVLQKKQGKQLINDTASSVFMTIQNHLKGLGQPQRSETTQEPESSQQQNIKQDSKTNNSQTTKRTCLCTNDAEGLLSESARQGAIQALQEKN